VNPEVSVVIPAYNTEAYIAKAIESVLEQTEQNLEIIVVDDASTDTTVEVAQQFNDPRLKVLVNQKNLGQNASLKRAIGASTGKWIAMLDSDDWYTAKRIERLLSVAYAENADMIADDLYYIQDGKSSPWGTLLRDSDKRIKQITLVDPIFFVENDTPGSGGLPLGLTKPMFKRDFLVQHGIEHDENIVMGQDFWFDMKCLAHGARFIFVPEPYYFYRKRQGSLVTGSKTKLIDEFCSNTRAFLEQRLVQENPDLVQALSKRLVLLEQTKLYYRVIDPLKQRKWSVALVEMSRNPYFFKHFALQLPKLLMRRLNYYFPNNI
jgi:succinoglycan biosynthesis protein ExoO